MTKIAITTTLDLRGKNKEEKKKFWLSFVIGKSYFGDDRLQNYLTFQPIFKYFTITTVCYEVLA